MSADVPREFPDVALRAARCGALALLTIAIASIVHSPNPDRRQSPGGPLRIDPNVATKEELMLLPDIGSATADAIIAARHSPDGTIAFASPADLDRVRGIGPRRIEKLRPHLRFATKSSE